MKAFFEYNLISIISQSVWKIISAPIYTLSEANQSSLVKVSSCSMQLVVAIVLLSKGLS